MAEEKIKAIFQRLTRQERQPEGPVRPLEPRVMDAFTGESVAAELRRAREDLGRDLVRIAGDLKIRRVYLEAIEEGRFDDLPGTTYAVGFIRAYADHLGLDSIEIVCRFKDEVEGVNERLQLVFPTPAPESKIPSGAVLLISVLLIALAYGGWYYLSSGLMAAGTTCRADRRMATAGSSPCRIASSLWPRAPRPKPCRVPWPRQAAF
jgi:cytoskeleton protein RodZ